MHGQNRTKSSSAHHATGSVATPGVAPKHASSSVPRRKPVAVVDKEILRKSGNHLRLVLTAVGLAILIFAVTILILNSYRWGH